MPTERPPPYLTGSLAKADLEGLIRGELQPAVWPGHEVQTLEIERARFSPGKELAVLCDVGLTAGSDLRNQRVLVTFAPSKGLEKAARRYRKKQKKLGRSAEGLRASEDGGHMFEVFPADWRLPTLSQVVDPDAVRRHAAPLILETHDVERVDVAIRELRYRPHTRYVVHYTCTSESGALRREAIGKAYGRRPKAERAWQLLTSMHAQAKEPVTPRPIGFVDEWRLTLMERVAGEPMFPILRDGTGDEQLRATRLAAQALATLHQLSIEEKPTRGLRRELKDLRKYVKEFQQLAPAIADKATRFADRLEGSVARIGDPSSQGPIHGAFKPSQLLVDRDRASIVDLDGFAVGEPAIDVGNYLAKLYKESLESGGSHLRDLGAPFIAEYLAAVGSSEVEARAHVHEAAALARLAFRELHTSRRSNDESSSAARMLDEGQACLDRL